MLAVRLDQMMISSNSLCYIDWKIQLWHIYEAYDGLAEIYEEPGVQYSFSLGKPYSGELVNGKIVSFSIYTIRKR